MNLPEEKLEDLNNEEASEEEEATASIEEIEEDIEAVDQMEIDLVTAMVTEAIDHQEARQNVSTVKERATSSRTAQSV